MDSNDIQKKVERVKAFIKANKYHGIHQEISNALNIDRKRVERILHLDYDPLAEYTSDVCNTAVSLIEARFPELDKTIETIEKIQSVTERSLEDRLMDMHLVLDHEEFDISLESVMNYYYLREDYQSCKLIDNLNDREDWNVDLSRWIESDWYESERKMEHDELSAELAVDSEREEEGQ